jgi:hypothetical protein
MRFHRDFIDSLCGKNELAHFSIERETNCLHLIRDIRDELNMIKFVLHSQREVFESILSVAKKQKRIDLEAELHKSIAKGPYNQPGFNNAWSNVSDDLTDDRTIHTITQRLEHLDNDAQRVETSVTPFSVYFGEFPADDFKLNHLLDLKQKQANIDEASSASKQAQEATRQAQETANQGKAILVFTVVTVIFVSPPISTVSFLSINIHTYTCNCKTPLSFMAALFSLPIYDQFPQSDRGGNSFSSRYIGTWMGRVPVD